MGRRAASWPSTPPTTTPRWSRTSPQARPRSPSSTTPRTRPSWRSLLGKSYAYIPVALSGTAESFLAGESNQGQNFPINQYKLTPNMVAGLLTSLYQSPAGTTSPPPRRKFELSDNLMAALAAADPPVTCAVLSGCPSTKGNAKQVAYETKYNAFALLNPVPDRRLRAPDLRLVQLQRGQRVELPGDPVGVQRPEHPVPGAGGRERPDRPRPRDGDRHQRRLVHADHCPIGSSIWPPYPGATWIFPQCQGYSTLPALSATATNFGADQEPAFQAKAMRTWCYGGGVLPEPTAARRTRARRSASWTRPRPGSSACRRPRWRTPPGSSWRRRRPAWRPRPRRSRRARPPT